MQTPYALILNPRQDLPDSRRGCRRPNSGPGGRHGPDRKSQAVILVFACFAKRRNAFLMTQRENAMDGAAGVFKALGHPARVRIVRTLADGEKCVCDLVAAAGLGWSSVSRHLSVLRGAGVVTDEKRGQQVIYRMALPCVNRFLDCLEHPANFPEMHAGCACDGP